MNEFSIAKARTQAGCERTREADFGFWDRLDPLMAERLQFLSSYLRAPASVGAVLPSSPQLARAMIEGCDLRHADTVVELGPGTGSFTRLILEHIGPSTTFFALELDRKSVVGLSRRFPDLVVYQDSAERIARYLGRHGKRSADYIVSGLPWASFKPELQDRIMRPVVKALAPGGLFTTFGYVHTRVAPNALRYLKSIRRAFRRVEVSPIVWRNFPPAVVYRCSRGP